MRSNDERGFGFPPLDCRWSCVKRGFSIPSPAAPLKGRQDADAVDRGGVRVKLLKAQARAGDIILLFADESEALPHPDLARGWAKGADLRVPAPGQAAKVAMMGNWDFEARTLIVHTSRTKHSTDFIAHLKQLDQLYGPKPGAPSTAPTVIVLDNGPIHTSKASLAQLQARSHWLKVEWLPK